MVQHAYVVWRNKNCQKEGYQNCFLDHFNMLRLSLIDDQYQSTPVFQELFVLLKVRASVRLLSVLCLDQSLDPACCGGIYFGMKAYIK